jgi:hypothetical protein
MGLIQMGIEQRRHLLKGHKISIVHKWKNYTILDHKGELLKRILMTYGQNGQVRSINYVSIHL